MGRFGSDTSTIYASAEHRKKPTIESRRTRSFSPPRPMLTHPHTKRIHETELNQIHQSSQDIIKRADVILLESVKLRNGSCRDPLYGIIMMYCVCRYSVCIAFSCIVFLLLFLRGKECSICYVIILHNGCITSI